jgi:hypothetical protein
VDGDGAADEHKLAARIVERDAALRGYRKVSRKGFGPEGTPSLQSFVVFELAVDPSMP